MGTNHQKQIYEIQNSAEPEDILDNMQEILTLDDPEKIILEANNKMTEIINSLETYKDSD